MGPTAREGSDAEQRAGACTETRLGGGMKGGGESLLKEEIEKNTGY